MCRWANGAEEGAGGPKLASSLLNMDAKYFVCLRWPVVCFKRESSIEDTTELWEVVWSKALDMDHFHIFMAAGFVFGLRRWMMRLPRVRLTACDD